MRQQGDPTAGEALLQFRDEPIERGAIRLKEFRRLLARQRTINNEEECLEICRGCGVCSLREVHLRLALLIAHRSPSR